MGDNVDEKIQTVIFSGEKKDWKEWKPRFIALAHLKEFYNVLSGKDTPPKEDATNLDATQEKLKKANYKGYYSLTISCKGDASGVVENAVTEDLPHGSVKEAWDQLEKIYEKKTKSEKVNLQERFHSCKMEKSTDNPVGWFNDLGNLRRRLKAAKEEMEDLTVVAHILKNLPDEYKPLTTGLYLKIDTLSLEELKDRVNNFYER